MTGKKSEKIITSASADAMGMFGPATRSWFRSAFPSPTAVQAAAWEAIRSGSNALVIAPTGSGKTLAAFLHAIDSLFEERAAASVNGKSVKPATRVLYISPLKALGADVHKNLRIPLEGVANERDRAGETSAVITVGMRTGDTPTAERANLAKRPPDILITTPESLYLMLTSKARETLRDVRTVIVDEVHAVAGTKRGSHLAVSLERLDALLPAPAQRIGLSATVRPVERVAEFLGGARPVTVVNPPSERRIDMKIVVPVEDMADLPVPAASSGGSEERSGRARSIWFHVEANILDRVLANRSTIVFVNSRGLAERMTARLNELYAERIGEISPAENEPLHYLSSNAGTGNRAAGLPPLIARSHHGSVSKERRNEIEQDLKTGELRCVVATSSLELGIDMGLVDLVIQVAAPPSVSSGLQRVGRAGHHVGGTPAGLVYPRTRRDLVDSAVTVEKMLAGQLEAVHPPRNPLDILAQQTVAAVAMETLNADEWYATVRKSDPFRSLSRNAFEATLDMLAGRFPSDEFAEFRPRIVRDRERGTLAARPGAQRLAVINGGTIPDRGTFGVLLPEGEEKAGSRRVGELDEEMVYESRVNDIITLGASSWRIQQITSDNVIVTPAPGRSARLPFWRGEGPGRPAELGEAIGAFLRAVDHAVDSGVTPNTGTVSSSEVENRLLAAGLDGNGAANLLNLLAEQRAATGALPTDTTLVIERCRDEVGDWRVMLHSPYGRRVHAPWALAIADRVRQRFKVDAAVSASDDGIVARIPDTDGRLPGAELFVFDPDAMQRLVTGAVGTSSLFAARFRECAARALLLPRHTPGRRSPLWQQRLRAGQLLEVARGYPDFPILVETARECLQDVYDMPALHSLMQRIAAGSVRFAEADTATPSSFAANLLFGYIGEFMYEDDAPLAERRASVLSLDIGLLSDLLGQTDFGELLDPSVIERVAAEMQRTAADRRVSGIEGVADLLRELGPLSIVEVAERLQADEEEAAANCLRALEEARRAIRVAIAGDERWAAVEDAARLRDALGVPLPDGIPEVFLEPFAEPLKDLVSRYARTHGPFTTGQLAARFGLGVAVAGDALMRLSEQGRVLNGDFGLGQANFRADSPANYLGNYPARHEWVWEDVFRRLRIRSLQAAREATRPVDGGAFVRQILERQHVTAEIAEQVGNYSGGNLHGTDGVARIIEQLAGVALPVSLWESRILPARVRGYSPGMLDELIATGEVVWSGSERLGDSDGMVALHLAELAPESLSPIAETASLSDLQRAVLEVLSGGGAYFASQIASLAAQYGSGGAVFTPSEFQEALWGLVWSGHITTDTWATLRAFAGSRLQRNVRRSTRKTRTVRRRIAGTYQSYAFTPKADALGAAIYGDAILAGRWSLLPRETVSETARAFALAESLFDRYGVVTRGAAVVEKIPGGFPALQKIFQGMEDAGRIMRGRFVEGLGGAQFADHLTINRLRELAAETDGKRPLPSPVALSAADPANPFGAILQWPEHAAKTKPSRRPGALAVLHGGRLVLWLAQGGKNLLTFIDETDPEERAILGLSLRSLAETLERGNSGTFTIENVDDAPVTTSLLAPMLREAGFSNTPQGLCWYARLKTY